MENYYHEDDRESCRAIQNIRLQAAADSMGTHANLRAQRLNDEYRIYNPIPGPTTYANVRELLWSKRLDEYLTEFFPGAENEVENVRIVNTGYDLIDVGKEMEYYALIERKASFDFLWGLEDPYCTRILRLAVFSGDTSEDRYEIGTGGFPIPANWRGWCLWGWMPKDHVPVLKEDGYLWIECLGERI